MKCTDVRAEPFLEAEAHARKIRMSIIVEDRTESVPEKFQSHGMSNDEEEASHVQRAVRIPQIESDPRGKNSEVKDLEKFFPEDLRKATVDEEMELILIMVVTERAESTRGSKAANTSTEGKSI